MHIGIAGVGRMGAAIALRLMEVGHQVSVWNRTPDKTAPLAAAGARVAETPAALASTVNVVLTILTHAPAQMAVYGGPDGVLAGEIVGKLVIDMSTVRPAEEVALAGLVRAKGATFVECPVGGTTGPAREGKLLGFAGGAPEDFARAKPVLEQLCRRVDLLGPIGAGASMKLAINLPLAVFWQSLGEAYALVGHLGLDPATVVELFTESSGGANVLKARGGAVALALASKEPGSATFDCDSIRKDLRTMVAEAGTLGLTLPLAQQTLGVFDSASAQGWGGRDCTELPAYWSKR